jgi:hypothetical protein
MLFLFLLCHAKIVLGVQKVEYERKKEIEIGLIKYFVDSDSESCSDVIKSNDFFSFAE